MVVPFAGTTEEGRALIAALERMILASADEVIVVDNAPAATLAAAGPDRGVRIIAAAHERSSYYARNVGAEAAKNPWILFLDGDCAPSPRLLDAYFEEPPGETDGAVMGEILPVAGRETLAAGYAAARGFLGQDLCRSHPYAPFGPTANLLVRRAAFLDLGGFCGGIRSGGDADFCWRLQARGWRLAFRRQAVVEHRHRETLGGLLTQRARYGAGHAWLERRYPGAHPRPRVARSIVKSVLGIAASRLGRRREPARYRLVDPLVTAAEAVGYLLDNRAPRPAVRAAPGPRDLGAGTPADDSAT